MQPPHSGDDWLGLTRSTLDVGAAYEWAVRADCGAVVVFSGTVRDHSDGRSGVEMLDYEAFDEQVVPRLHDVAGEVRRRWTGIGRIVMHHRTGRVAVGESSVVVAVSSPHRAEAFEAGRYAIDALKATVPIWKHETWAGGAGWSEQATAVAPARDVVATTPEATQ